jgi:hypothetical protein
VAAADAGKRFIEARRALRERCPVELPDAGDLHGYFVTKDSTNALQKIETFRCGLDFAVSYWPEPADEIPSILDRLTRVDDILAKRRDEDLATNGPTDGGA